MMMNTETLKTVNLNELEKLAKLLATENIVVEHQDVPTASFDTKNRVLTLPRWNDITPALYHMLVVHEISHALETDPVKWEETCKANPGIHATLNIVEDARIERLAKRRYPGTRRDFRDGYAELMERDFFKLNSDLNTYSFIDRLNIHYKIGHLVAVPFSDEEQAFVRIIDTTDDMDGIIAVALRLFQRAKDKNENKPAEQEKQEGEADSDENMSQPSDEEDGVDGESDEDADANETDGPSEKSGDKPEQGDGETEDSEAGKGAGSADETVSETQTNLDDEMKTLNAPAKYGSNTYVDYGRRVDYQKYIVSYKDTIASALKSFTNINGASAPMFTAMRNKNIRVVDYLCKEFEQRKAADQYIRAKEAKSGVINPNKLHSYKMVDDIFRKVTVNPDAKNHGLVIMIDFSGSMWDNMLGTIEQLLTIVMFCRKTGIAHRVYGFLDGWGYNRAAGIENESARIHVPATGRKTMVPDEDMRLVELFSEKMNLTEFRTMTECLLYAFTPTGGWTNNWNMVREFRLNGTPLDGALILARDMVADFKVKTRSQIVSLVLLTDGGSNGCVVMNADGTYNNFGGLSGYGDKVVRDVRTGKVYTFNGSVTDTLVKIIRNDGFEVTNFYISSGKRDGNMRIASFTNSTNGQKFNYEILAKEFRKSGAIAMPENDGYSEYYLILGGANLRTEGEDEFEFEVKTDATNKQIAKAFADARKDRMGSRIILQNFAKKIAA